MLCITPDHSSALGITLVFALASLASADTPRVTAPPKSADSEPAQKVVERPPLAAKTQSDIDLEFKRAQLDRQAAKQEAEGPRLEAEHKAWWDALSPKMQDLISPEITAAQYDLVASKLKEHGWELLEVVDKACEDNIIRLLEFGTIQARWESIEIDKMVREKPETKARTKELIRVFRNAQK